MSKQEDDMQSAQGSAENELRDTGNTATREDEKGDVAEANAPTAVRRNIGMNTILDGGFGTGIQTDASDE